MESTEENVQVVILDKKLETVVTSTKFDLTKAQSHAVAFAPCMEKVNELSKGLSIMDKENPSEIDAKMARMNRLALVKARGSAKAVKEELKSSLIIEGKLIDNLFGVVESTADLTEAEYAKIEKFAENKEKERKAKLFNERVAYLSAVCENPSIYPLGDMEESDYNNLYEGLRLADQAKRDAQIKAENDRIAAEKLAEEERIEAKRIADEEAEKQRLENERLKAEAEIKEKRTTQLLPLAFYIADIAELLSLPEEEYQNQFEIIQQGAVEHLAAEEEKRVQAEKDLEEERRIAKEKQDEVEAKAREEKEKADKLLADQQRIADENLKAEQEKARLEKEESDRKQKELEAELQSKKDAEAESKRQADLAAEAELQKGDKQRFDDLLQDIELLKYKNAGKFKTAKFKKLHDQMFEMFDKMIKHGQEKK